MTHDDMREAAKRRLLSKRGFYRYLAWAAVVTVVLVIIWAATGMGYFWPMWPIIAFVIGTIFSAYSAFGPGSRPISEADIDNEVRKMNGGQ